MGRSQKGYSTVELMMVVVIAVVTAGIAIPTTANTIGNINLRGAASSFASLAQQARLMAIQKNATYTVGLGLPGAQGAFVEQASGASPSYTAGEPMVQFGGSVEPTSAPTANPTKLDAAGGPLASWTVTSGNVSFNARGVPCNAAASPCGTNVNYIFYFSDRRAFGGRGWAAVSITSAGRTKAWWWNGSSWIG